MHTSAWTFAVIALLPLGACIAPTPPVGPPAPAPDLELASTGRVWFGPRQMRGDGWERTDDQFVFGFDGSVRPEGWPVGVELGLQLGGGGDWDGYYYDDDYNQEPYQDVYGLSLGLNRRWVVSRGQVLLDVGAGVEWQYTDREEAFRSEGDGWFGGYARGMAALVVGGGMFLGIEVRGSYGDGPTIFGQEYGGEALQETFVFGGGF